MMDEKNLNIKQMGEEVERVNERVKQLNSLMAAVVVVLLIAMVGMLLTLGAFINDSLAEKKAISQDMRDQLYHQNLKLDELTKQIQNLQPK